MGGKTDTTIVIILIAVVMFLLLARGLSLGSLNWLRPTAKIVIPYEEWNHPLINQVRVNPDGGYNGSGYDFIPVPFAKPVSMQIINTLVVIDGTPDNIWFYGVAFDNMNSQSFIVYFNAPPHSVGVWTPYHQAVEEINYSTKVYVTLKNDSTLTLTTDLGQKIETLAGTNYVNRVIILACGYETAKSGSMIINYDLNSTSWLDLILKKLTGGSS